MCCSALSTGMQSVMQNVAQLVRSLPCTQHVVVVTFVLRRHQTNVLIEIQELEGGVRATGLLCLFGVTVGIGSVLVYQLYTRLFSKSSSSLSESCRKRGVSKSCPSEKSDAVTPDSGIVDDSFLPSNFNNDSFACAEAAINVPRPTDTSTRRFHQRHFTEFAGFNSRRSSASLEDVLFTTEVSDGHVQRSLAVADWLAQTRTNLAIDDDDDSLCPSGIHIGRGKLFDSLDSPTASSVDHGFASGWMTESAEFQSQEVAARRSAKTIPWFDESGVWHRVFGDGSAAQGTSCGRQSVDRLKLDLSAVSHNRLFDDEGVHQNGRMRMLKKRGMSESGIGESMFWGQPRRRFSTASGASVSDCDYRESLVSKGYSIDLGEDLRGIIPSPIEDDAGKLDTLAGMESLQNALRYIQLDIDDMNEKFDDLRYAMVPNQVSMQLNPAIDASQWSIDDDISSCSNGQSEFFRSASQQEILPDSLGTMADFAWDYRSDLVHSNGASDHGFVTQRPLIGQSLDNNCNYHLSSTSSPPRTRSDEGSWSGPDIYIDDDIRVEASTSITPIEYDPAKMRHWNKDEVDSDGHQSFKSSSKSSPMCDTSPLPLSGGNNTVGESVFECCCSNSVGHSPRSSCLSRKSSASKRSHCCHRCIPSCHEDHDHFFAGIHEACSSNHVQCQASSFVCERSGASPASSSSVALCQCAHTMSLNANSDHCNNFTAKPRPSSCASSGRGSGCVVVGELKDVRTVLDAHLLSTSQRSHTAIKNCQQVMHLWAASSMRSAGKDVYSAIRAVIYASLIENHPLLSRCGNLNDCCQKLVSYSEAQHKYLRSWNFASTESLCLENTVVSRLIECLCCLFEQVEIVSKLPTRRQRDEHVSSAVSGNPTVDRRVIEAVKVLTMLSAIGACEDLASDAAAEARCPVFVSHMFGRSSSVTAETFFHNHINCVEDAAVLCNQPPELSFLAYTLDVRLQIFHVSRTSECDHLRHYPDAGADHLPSLRLLEADRGSYYVPV